MCQLMLAYQGVEIEVADVGGGEDGERGQDGGGPGPVRPPVDATQPMLGCSKYPQDDGDGCKHDCQAQTDGADASQHVKTPALHVAWLRSCRLMRHPLFCQPGYPSMWFAQAALSSVVMLCALHKGGPSDPHREMHALDCFFQ